MKHGISLAFAAAATAVMLTGCGGRMDRNEEREPEVTAVTTEETKRSGKSKTVQGVEDMASEAAENVSEAVSDAAEQGRSIVTGAATDVSEAIADRKGDGDYRTDEDGAVQAQD